MEISVFKSLAQNRVDNVPELKEFESIIMYDWPEGDEHWSWVLSAPVSTILEWAKDIVYWAEE